MRTLALLLVSVLLASAIAEEDTVNLNYKAPLPTYQVPYEKDTAYAANTVPYLFDYLPPVLPKSPYYGKKRSKKSDLVNAITRKSYRTVL